LLRAPSFYRQGVSWVDVVRRPQGVMTIRKTATGGLPVPRNASIRSARAARNHRRWFSRPRKCQHQPADLL